MGSEVIVGFDVPKAHLDVAVRPGGESRHAEHDDAGTAQVVERLQGLAPRPVLVEATGVLETAVAVALAAAGLMVAVLHPRQVRALAKATGRSAKGDRLIAQVLARFGEAVRSRAGPLADSRHPAPELSGDTAAPVGRYADGEGKSPQPGIGGGDAPAH